MNKNGFTLVELLIIIGVLALMGGLFSINMTRILNKTNDSNEVEISKELQNAADVYFAINKELLKPLYDGSVTSISVSIHDLKSLGLIDKNYAVNGNKISDNALVKAYLGTQGELVFVVDVSKE